MVLGNNNVVKEVGNRIGFSLALELEVEIPRHGLLGRELVQPKTAISMNFRVTLPLCDIVESGE